MTPPIEIYSAFCSAFEVAKPFAHQMYHLQVPRIRERLLVTEERGHKLLAFDVNEWVEWLGRETKMPDAVRSEFKVHAKVLLDWVDLVRARPEIEEERFEDRPDREDV